MDVFIFKGNFDNSKVFTDFITSDSYTSTVKKEGMKQLEVKDTLDDIAQLRAFYDNRYKISDAEVGLGSFHPEYSLYQSGQADELQ